MSVRPFVVIFVGVLVACEGVPCDTQRDCPTGMFCRVSDGQCDFECLKASECPTPSSPTRQAICNNQGRCATAGREPRLLVESPLQGAVFAPGTKAMPVAGRVISAASTITLTVDVRSEGGCQSESIREVRITNPQPGTLSEIPFTLDRVPLTPGPAAVRVVADVGDATRSYFVDVQLECPGCPEVVLEEPRGSPILPAPVLPRVGGTVLPAIIDGRAMWRVRDAQGQVFDGPLTLSFADGSSRFRKDRLPVFPGFNEVEVLVPVSGQAVEGRCSTSVTGPPAPENSLRLVLTWDATDSDLDLVLLGPEATLDGFEGILSPRLADPNLAGTVLDDFDGEGPEQLFTESLPDGVYGVAVEALSDGTAPGSNALLRVLFEGRLLTDRPLGPHFLSSTRGDIWIVGRVAIQSGSADWLSVDEIVTVDEPPSRPPSEWPRLY